MCRSSGSPPDHQSDHVSTDSVETTVYISTSGGRTIPAHAQILASASPVLEGIIDNLRKYQRLEEAITIPGVPCDAVEVFVNFLYTNRCSEVEMEKFGIHLLALAHVYMVPQLKTQCSKALIRRLTVENVVDVLQLARLCDAPDLYLKCMRLISNRFKPVEETEGWKFLQNNDPFLELEILKFIDESESRRKSTKKRMWQLFKLHSSICDQSSDTSCKVPLCRQFKTKGQQVNNKKQEARWELLVRKVEAAKAVSSVSLPKTKLEHQDYEQEEEPRSFREAMNCHVSVAC
ncbi:putative chromatin remodeling & transcription regulator BTB-POZ family [Helianthus annuus]|nr:putative chromatin remodeling & transcription regulator BTB-POZ family [Helianthus annuus]